MHKVSPAINRFHCVLVALLNMKRFTVNGLSSLSPMRILGSRKSFQDHIKNNTPIVTVAGLTSGNTICVIIRKTPHPSIAAASSSSRGTFFKNPVNVRIPNAQKNPISRMIIPNAQKNSSKRIGKIGICSKYRNGNHNCMKRHDLSENKIQIQIL